MSITLTHTPAVGAPTTLTLSERLVWSDEHAWQAPQMATDYGTQGDLMVHVRARNAGRPITLEGVDSAAWMTLAQVQALQAWAAIPGAQFTLHLRGVDRTVMFDATEGAAIDARPLWPLADGEQTAGMPMQPTFRFIEI